MDIATKIHKKITDSTIAKRFVARLLYLYVQLVYKTSFPLSGSQDPKQLHKKYNPYIITFWHGQHLMGPVLRPKDEKITAMFSRSKDAEINAILGKMLGLDIVRGSGGRGAQESKDKGGARALLVLRNCLREGSCVSMIANVSKLDRREAGRGIIMLAKISSRPIIPYIYSFSRKIVFEKSWDKMALPLPFSKTIFLAGQPFYVDKDSTEEEVEQKRQELTKILDELTQKAEQLLKNE